MIAINVEKAKEIAHVYRRAARAMEFAPLDEMIAKAIPGYENAEPERVAIREQYAEVQAAIDEAKDEAELMEILSYLPEPLI